MRRKTLVASVLAGVLVAGLSVVGADAAGRDDKVAHGAGGRV
ncbi:MAG: hypothetical protein QOH03_2730 [Kribbellaceae bacterium]|nr:hypothetical protein [Kribbellaceae bacterium]